MDGTITTVQSRGQITLPLMLRKKLGLGHGAMIRVSLVRGKIMAEPVRENVLSTPPKYSREEIAKRLKKYENDGKVYWTAEDDKYLAKLRKKDDKYLDW